MIIIYDIGSVDMSVKFIINDYILVWNLLYNKSITSNLERLKDKVQNNYKKQYDNIYKEKEAILKDGKNFIPNNDTIYNLFFEENDFKILKRNCEKQRVKFVKLWDKYNKNISRVVRTIIRKNLSNYTCFIVNEEFSIRECKKYFEKEGVILLGDNCENINSLLIDIFYQILLEEVVIEKDNYLDIKKVIVEMAILDELATQLNENSCYKKGNHQLFYLKKQIYPYWLMYLGISKEDMVKYMERDKITFDIEKIFYNKELASMDIDEFIEYIIKNKKQIIKIDRLTL